MIAVGPLSVCVCVCVSDAKLLLQFQSHDVHFWPEYASRSWGGSLCVFMTLGQRSRSPARSRSFEKIKSAGNLMKRVEN